MRKVVSIFLAVLYLALSSGLALEIHHCMGEIADFSLIPSKKDACSSCGMPVDSNSCCKDELKFVKIQDSYKLSAVNYVLEVPPSDLHINQYQAGAQALESSESICDDSISPPRYPDSYLYLINCTLRI